jgi:hypothetical protein
MKLSTIGPTARTRRLGNRRSKIVGGTLRPAQPLTAPRGVTVDRAGKSKAPSLTSRWSGVTMARSTTVAIAAKYTSAVVTLVRQDEATTMFVVRTIGHENMQTERRSGTGWKGNEKTMKNASVRVSANPSPAARCARAYQQGSRTRSPTRVGRIAYGERPGLH